MAKSGGDKPTLDFNDSTSARPDDSSGSQPVGPNLVLNVGEQPLSISLPAEGVQLAENSEQVSGELYQAEAVDSVKVNIDRGDGSNEQQEITPDGEFQLGPGDRASFGDTGDDIVTLRKMPGDDRLFIEFESGFFTMVNNFFAPTAAGETAPAIVFGNQAFVPTDFITTPEINLSPIVSVDASGSFLIDRPAPDFGFEDTEPLLIAPEVIEEDEEDDLDILLADNPPDDPPPDDPPPEEPPEEPPENLPPIALDDFAVADPNEVLNVSTTILVNDSDPDNDPLEIVGFDTISAKGAKVTVNPDGTYSYDPRGIPEFQALEVGQTGTDSFTYVITDVDGSGQTASATVFITLQGQNDLVAEDDCYEVDELTLLSNGNLVITPAGEAILSNDFDPNNDAFQITEINGLPYDDSSIYTSTEGAQISVNEDGTFTYTPVGQVLIDKIKALTPGEQLDDFFTYTIVDEFGLERTAEVKIRINGENLPPDAEDDCYMTDEDTILEINALEGLLTNDSDPDIQFGDEITVTKVFFDNEEYVVDSDGVTFTSQFGALVKVYPDGRVEYDPTHIPDDGSHVLNCLDEGQSITDFFFYQITDNFGATATAKAKVVVEGRNDLEANPDLYIIGEDTLLADSMIINDADEGILANDFDPEGHVFQIISVNGIPYSTSATYFSNLGAEIQIRPDGRFRYNPVDQDLRDDINALVPGQSLFDTYTYAIEDSSGLVKTTTVTIEIEGDNDTPDAVDDCYTMPEGDILTFNILENDSDPDFGDELTVSIIVVGDTEIPVGPDGVTVTSELGVKVTVMPDGTVTYDTSQVDPRDQLNSGSITDLLGYQVKDKYGDDDFARIKVKLESPNNPPDAEDDCYMTDENTVLTLNVNEGILSNDSDPDQGDVIKVTKVFVGSDSYDVGPNGVTFFSEFGATVRVYQDGRVEYDPTETDPNGDFHFDCLDEGQCIEDLFRYEIMDQSGATDTAQVKVKVSGVNELVAEPDNYTIGEDTLLADSMLIADANEGILANDFDPEGHAFQIISVNGIPYSSSATYFSNLGAEVQIRADGRFRYDPVDQDLRDDINALAPGQSLFDSYTYAIEDSSGLVKTTTVNIEIEGDNDTPDAVDDCYNMPEGDLLTFNILENDSDPDFGDEIRVTAVVVGDAVYRVGPDGVTVTSELGVKVTVMPDGTVTYDTSEVDPRDSITEDIIDKLGYQITDKYGDTDFAHFKVALEPDNQAPEAKKDRYQTDEDTVLTITPDGILRNDSDPDGDDLTVIKIRMAGQNYEPGDVIITPRGATLVVNADGSLSYDPRSSAELNALQDGDLVKERLTYTISDGEGGVDSARVVIKVLGVNDGPDANDDRYQTDENTVLTITPDGILNNDLDLDGDDLSVVKITVDGVDYAPGDVITTPAGATLVVNADGSLSYDPSSSPRLDALQEGESAEERFDYMISDGEGGMDTAEVVIKVLGVNDGPDANDDRYQTDEDSVLTITPEGILSNDLDLDGDDLSVVKITVDGVDYRPGDTITTPAGAMLIVNADGSLEYDPTSSSSLNALSEGEHAFESFDYMMSDGSGGMDTAEVTIKVLGINDPPIAHDDEAMVHECDILHSDESVLANDIELDANDSIKVISTGELTSLNGSGATLLMNADGSYTYDPGEIDPAILKDLKDGDTFFDKFRYEISDESGATASATLTIAVKGATNLPIVGTNDNDVIEASDECCDKLIIGDMGGTLELNPSFNLLFVLDTSGSMLNKNSSGQTRLEVLKDAVMETVALYNSFRAEYPGVDVTVQFMEFNNPNRDSSPLDGPTQLLGGQFVLDGQTGAGSVLDQIQTQIFDPLEVRSSNATTSYTSAMDVADNYMSDINQVDADINTVYFVSDGRPCCGNEAYDFEQGINNNEWSDLLGDPSEISVRAVGIGTNINNSEKRYLNMVDNSAAGAVVVTDLDSTALADTLSELVLSTIENQPVGEDTIWAGHGDDVIYGDALSHISYDELPDDLLGQAGADVDQNATGYSLLVSVFDGDREAVREYLQDSEDDYANAQLWYDASYGEADIISGGGGDDVIFGGGGDDELFGDEGADTIYGGSGDDYIEGGAGADVIFAEAGDDIVLLDVNDAFVDAGMGDDTLMISGHDQDIDLSMLEVELRNFNHIDITGDGDNSLALNMDDVLTVSDDSDTLYIHGDNGDHVALKSDSGGDWSLEDANAMVDGVSYSKYVQGSAVLFVDNQINTEQVIDPT